MTILSKSRTARPAFIILLTAITLNCSAQDGLKHSDAVSFQVDTVVGGLENPWSLAFLPNGDMLVTEKPGRLRIIRDGQLLDESVPGVPEVYARGQGGLLDVILHPEFEENSFIYMSYSHPGDADGESTTAVVRARFENDALHDVEEIFVADSRGRGHYGSRLAFDADGYLFVTVGDRQAPPRGDLEAHPSQDLSNHHGTINRLHDDGQVPEDNPFVGNPDAKPEIWSYGHRNPQGLAIDPGNGRIWSVEHGPQGGDELNLVRRGANYGWPVIGYGVNYGSGDPIHESTHRDGMEQPITYWVPSIATSGLMIYTGEAFPQWQGSIFVGGLAGTQVARVQMDGENVDYEETLLERQGRIRDIRQGPDGFIYVLIDDGGGPRSVLRLTPERISN